MKKPLSHHLKHWFVAHHRNNHRPHLISRSGLVAVALAIVAIQGLSLTAHAVAHGSVLAYATGDINVSDLLAQTNQQRADNGLAPLKLDNRLVQSAGLKANDMFTYNYWAHVSPSGVQPWYWFTQAGYNYSYAGENLAKDFDTTTGVMDGWMNSPGHRANILNVNYVDVGFAVENGTLVGGQTTLVVAHYGSQVGTQVAANVVAATPKPVQRAAAPVATPLPVLPSTPAPTPAPTAKPVSTPTPPSPVATSGNITQAPPSSSYRPISPLAATRIDTPATKATVIILIVLLLVYLQTHIIVWRKGLKRWQHLHYRLVAAGQVSGLLVAITIVISTGGGRVG